MNVLRQRLGRVCQGDIYKDVEFIEYVITQRGSIEISKIMFPFIIVLTQDCDLEQDSKIRFKKIKSETADKLILSVLVAPLYNVEHVYSGEHLKQLGIQMQMINKNKTSGNNLRNNETPRYHYIEFPSSVSMVPSVIDFKHYFSVNVEYLRRKKSDFICRVPPLFREDLSQRFASFLSRIGLPEMKKETTSEHV